MALRLACLDWYPGFDHSHIYVRLLARALLCRVKASRPEEADLILVGPYGRNKELIQKRRGQIIIYGSGENTRPDYRYCDISLTLDLCAYGGRNVRVPAWAGEFDFWGDAPTATYNQAETEKVLATNRPLSPQPSKASCPHIAAIFSTYEQNRISVLEALEMKVGRVTKVGKLWGNGEECRDADKLFSAKRPILTGHAMNLCFENSIAPGYVTEKILHARMAGCVALSYVHQTYQNDYDKNGVINFEEFLDTDLYIQRIKALLSSPDTLLRLREGPVFAATPKPNELVKDVQLLLANHMHSWR